MADGTIDAIGLKNVNGAGYESTGNAHLASNTKDELDKTDVFSFAAKHPKYC